MANTGITFEEYLRDVRVSMQHMHPNVSRYPEIAVLLANELAYQLWRKARVYDHFDIVFGVKTPDGQAGYSIIFSDDRAGGKSTAISLTAAELQELVEKGQKALGQGV
jgi:hypothetical protein